MCLSLVKSLVFYPFLKNNNVVLEVVPLDHYLDSV
jgi:hypothetical protein